MLTLNEEDEKKYVNFFKIPKTSFLTIKSRKQDYAGKYYENLLQVVVRNQTFIYDLDDASGQPTEIHFVHDMEQMIDPDGFVNSGIIPSIVEKVKSQSEMTSILTNEQVTLYITEEEQVLQIKLGGKLFAHKKTGVLPSKSSSG